MTFVRHYVMHAKEGAQDDLRGALVELAAKVAARPGAESVALFSDDRDQRNYIFIERWSSAEAQEATGIALGRSAFARVMAALDQPPERRDLQLLGEY